MRVAFRLTLLIVLVLVVSVAVRLSLHVSSDPLVLGRYSVLFFVVLLAVWVLTAFLIVIVAWPRAFSAVFERRRELVLLGFASILPLIVVETIVRITDLMGVSYYEELKRYNEAMLPDDILIYRHPANSRAVYQEVLVETNAMGLRDAEIGQKQFGEFRVLALGDSVTFGWGVAAADSFVEVLERELSVSLGRKVQVVNSGVGSYNTVQQAAFLEHRGLEIEPDAVILTFVSNDVIIHERRDAIVGAIKPPVSVPQRLVALLGNAWTYRLAVHLLRVQRGVVHNLPGPGSDGWAAALAALAEIIDYCDEHTLPLVIVLYEHVSDETSRALAGDIATLTSARGVPFVTTRAWLERLPRQEIVNSPTDSHLNPVGNRLLAEGLHDFLLRTNLGHFLPPDKMPVARDGS